MLTSQICSDGLKTVFTLLIFNIFSVNIILETFHTVIYLLFKTALFHFLLFYLIIELLLF